MSDTLFLAGLIGEHLMVRTLRDLTEQLRYSEPDVVINALSFPETDAKTFQTANELLQGRNFGSIGTNADALVLVNTKDRLRDLWWRSDIRTPSSFSLGWNGDDSIAEMDWLESANSFPYTVKPGPGPDSDDPGFAAVVSSSAELREKAGALLRRFDSVRIEQFLGNREDLRWFSVGSIGNKDRSIVMPAEIGLSGGITMNTVTERDISRHRVTIAPILDKKLRDEVERFAREAIEAPGVKDFARLDLLMSSAKLYAFDLKVQPEVPDLLFEACARLAGLDANQCMTAIFVAGFARLFLEGFAHIPIPSRLRNMVPRSIFPILYG
jgi:D-alanine-D-alanine ligase-like ATP-grasp enzyme